MLQVPSREDLVTLTSAADAVAPSVALGWARRLDAGRVSVFYAFAHGIGEMVVEDTEVPDALRPSEGGVREADAASMEACRLRAVEAFLLDSGVRRLASIRLPRVEPAARLWIGLAVAEPLTEDQLEGLAGVAGNAAAVLTAGRSPSEEMARLVRLERAAGLQPALLHVLDIREVFDRLSTAAKSVLPHDLLLLSLFEEDLAKFRIYARTGGRADFTTVLPNPYPAAAIRAWEFSIVDDYSTHPMERDSPARDLGARSSIRFPVRFDNRVIGGVVFLSFETGKYSEADVAVGRRLTDHVAVGLSHYQLAEAGRRAAAIQERTANLDLLDGLMNAITGVLDVREVFDRVFEISQRSLPYDAMSIALPTADGAGITLYATTGALRHLQTPMDFPLRDRSIVDSEWEFELCNDCRADPRYAWIPSVKAGMQSLIIIPIRLEERLRAWVNFWSASTGRFSTDDVPIARRIAAHIALTLSHQRLAEQARVNAELRARTGSIELLDELLSALMDSGELRDVFERVSATAAKVLPHDAAVLMVRLPDGKHARIYASSGFRGPMPDVAEVPEELLENPDWEHEILDDLSVQPHARYARIAAIGLRSLLRVVIRLDGKFAGALVFFGKEVSAFRSGDVLVARRVADRLAVTLARDREIEASRRADEAAERARALESRVRALTDELNARSGFHRVVGDSVEWRQVLTQATQVAATEATVLLLGESGTGKEVVARFVHGASARGGGPFIALNCAALPEQLLEAELFGYERGAYTGATQSKPGQLEQASGGTLFLDEVGEMSLPAQAKFLRVLQEREFQRLGGTRVLRTDARIVAATNRDLLKAMANGQFREDLYYRLNVFAIRLPSLRERRDDILALSEAFLGDISRGLGRPPAGISRDARQVLMAYHWPGNVRELRNILERAAILCDGGLITAEQLAVTVVAPPAAIPPVAAPRVPAPAEVQAALPVAPTPPQPAAPADLQSMERTMIEQALQNARFNKSKAAKALGLTRQQLYVRMRKYGFE